MAIKETAAANKKETEDWDAVVRQRKMLDGVKKEMEEEAAKTAESHANKAVKTPDSEKSKKLIDKLAGGKQDEDEKDDKAKGEAEMKKSDKKAAT